MMNEVILKKSKKTVVSYKVLEIPYNLISLLILFLNMIVYKVILCYFLLFFMLFSDCNITI